MRKPRLTMDGFMEAQDFDRTMGNAIGASDRSMIDTQRDIILGLEARVAELETENDDLRAEVQALNQRLN